MLRILNKRTESQLYVHEGEKFQFDKLSNINDDMIVQEKEDNKKGWRTLNKIEYDIKIKEKDNSIKIKKTGDIVDRDLDRLVDGIQKLIDQFKNQDERNYGKKNNTYAITCTKKKDANEKGKYCHRIVTDLKKESTKCLTKEKINNNNNNDLLSKWKRIAITSESDEEKKEEQNLEYHSSSNENNQSDDNNDSDYFL